MFKAHFNILFCNNHISYSQTNYQKIYETKFHMFVEGSIVFEKQDQNRSWKRFFFKFVNHVKFLIFVPDCILQTNFGLGRGWKFQMQNIFTWKIFALFWAILKSVFEKYGNVYLTNEFCKKITHAYLTNGFLKNIINVYLTNVFWI